MTGHSFLDSKFWPAARHWCHRRLGFFNVLSLPWHRSGHQKTSLTSLPSEEHPLGVHRKWVSNSWVKHATSYAMVGLRQHYESIVTKKLGNRFSASNDFEFVFSRLYPSCKCLYIFTTNCTTKPFFLQNCTISQTIYSLHTVFDVIIPAEEYESVKQKAMVPSTPGTIVRQ